MSIMQKIEAKRQELRERAIIMKMSAKDRVKSGWIQLKDFILVLYLLNTLIGLCQRIDIMALMPSDTMVKTIVIDNSAATHLVGKASAETKVDAPDNKVEVITSFTTAYSEKDSCHYEGCLMASGKRAYVGAVACPRSIALNTRITIDGKPYVCEDRTAITYDGRFDIFMGYGDEAYQQAIKYGKQEKKVEIFE